MAESIVSQNSDGTYNISHLNQYGQTISEPIENIPGYASWLLASFIKFD